MLKYTLDVKHSKNIVIINNKNHQHVRNATITQLLCSATMFIAYPLPHLCIIIVGFIKCKNARTCGPHPDGYRNVVLESNDHGVGILFCLWMVRKDELVAYTVKPDGSDGCCIAFVLLMVSFLTATTGWHIDFTTTTAAMLWQKLLRLRNINKNTVN
jgi:hypothetical protein